MISISNIILLALAIVLVYFVIKYVIVPLFWLIILGIINWLTKRRGY